MIGGSDQSRDDKIKIGDIIRYMTHSPAIVQTSPISCKYPIVLKRLRSRTHHNVLGQYSVKYPCSYEILSQH